MRSIKETKGASIIVNTCAGVKSEEDVLVVTDWLSADVAKRVAAAAREKSDNVSMTIMNPPEHAGNNPPETVLNAIRAADVVFQLTRRPIAHSEGVRKASDENTRNIVYGKPKLDELVDGGLYVDYDKMKPYCDEMAQKFSEADEAYLSSPQGTDLKVDISGRAGNSHPGTAREPGSFTGLINVEANTAPVSAEGTVVFDGAIPDLDIGQLDEKVKMEIKEGSVVDIIGGKEAEKLQRTWDQYDDPAIYNIAQLAVGMNPQVREFSDRFQEAHARYGNVHLGIGTSSNLGGSTQTPLHFDAMMAEATLELDGEVVLKEGSTFPFVDLD